MTYVETMFVCMAVLLWPTVSDTIIGHIDVEYIYGFVMLGVCTAGR